ncbi:Acetyl esterase [compost metagenome]
MPLQVIEDVAYGNDPEQRLDILMPKERSQHTKVLIFLHGGSWKRGDKSDYNSALRSFAQRGIAIVNMNYRLAEKNKNKFPAQMDDITKAIDFLVSKANDLSIDMTTIGLAGHSAGGHLALLYSYHFNTSGRVKAVAALAPVSDLAEAGRSDRSDYLSPIINFLGKKFKQDSILWIQASPYWMATKLSVPTILFHGTEDKVVPYNQSVKLEKRLQELKVPTKYIEYDAGHVWLGSDLVDTRENVIKWMNTYVN